MTPEEEFWAGKFGDDYIARNHVNWWERVPFWADLMARVGKVGVLEIGCNAGWNLMAIRATGMPVYTCGIDVNKAAVRQAQAFGLDAVETTLQERVFFQESYGLVFTAGVLIHVSPEYIAATMRDIISLSTRYVLAVEYDTEQGQREEAIEYRGHQGKLWRRDFGAAYQEMGLRLLWKKWPIEGFDNCTAWLLEKMLDVRREEGRRRKDAPGPRPVQDAAARAAGEEGDHPGDRTLAAGDRNRVRRTGMTSRREKQRAYKAERALALKANPPEPLTHGRLLQVIHYDPETGIFERIGRSGKRTDLTGTEAGGRARSNGYVRVAVDDRRYKAHRLAWFYMTGKWPDREVDHKNTIRADNRWDNLRQATSTLNKQNRQCANKNNGLALLGVSRAPAGKFKARIDGQHIGVFDTPEAAHAAYVKEKRERHEGNQL